MPRRVFANEAERKQADVEKYKRYYIKKRDIILAKRKRQNLERVEKNSELFAMRKEIRALCHTATKLEYEKTKQIFDQIQSIINNTSEDSN